jgi:hypothetical protein
MNKAKVTTPAVLPKVLYARYNDEDLPKDAAMQFLLTYDTLQDAAENGFVHTVGVYELKEIKKVELVVSETIVEK